MGPSPSSAIHMPAPKNLRPSSIGVTGPHQALAVSAHGDLAASRLAVPIDTSSPGSTMSRSRSRTWLVGKSPP